MGDISDVVVGEKFWLRRAQVLVEGAIDRRDAAAVRLTSAIGWFWSVYSGSAVLTAALKQQPYSTARAIVLACPAVLLIVAYCAAVWATLPTHLRFDPRSPVEIEIAHERIARSKHVRLMIALILTLISAIGVGVAMVVAATSH